MRQNIIIRFYNIQLRQFDQFLKTNCVTIR